MSQVIYRTKQGDTVDLIAWGYYGRTAGTVEAVLAANPGLGDAEVLDEGIDVVMPEVTATETTATVKLWS